MAAMFLAGLILRIAQRDGIPPHHISALLARSSLPLEQPVLFDGCVTDEVEDRGEELAFTVSLHGFSDAGVWSRCSGKVALRMPVSTDLEGIPAARLRYGDRIRGWAEWHVPRNFRNPGSLDYAGFLARRGVLLVGRVKSPRLIEVLPGACRDRWKGRALSIRGGIRAFFQRLDTPGSWPRGAILTSLLLGDQSRLDQITREVFQNSGTYHILVVSGLHVTWIAWILLGMVRTSGLPPPLGRLVLALGLGADSSLVGFEASISRCLWMFAFFLLGQTLQRDPRPLNLAFASGLALLVLRPDWLWDLGFQLSFLSIAAIFTLGSPWIETSVRPLLQPMIHAGRPDRLSFERGRWHKGGRNLRARVELFAEGWADRWHPRPEGRCLGAFRMAGSVGFWVGSMLLISLAIQVCLTPLLILHFNRVSWISPLANVPIVPLSSLTLGAAALAAMAVLLGVPAGLLLEPAASLCSALIESANRSAGLPGAWQRCVTPSAAGVFIAVGAVLTSALCYGDSCVLSARWSFCRWRSSHPPLRSFSALPGSGDPAARPAPSRSRSSTSGRGMPSRSVFRTHGSRVLDAGGIRDGAPDSQNSRAFDVGESVVSRYLWSQWISSLNQVLLSHPHLDHAGGIPALLRNFRVEALAHSGAAGDPVLHRLRSEAERLAEFRFSACKPETGSASAASLSTCPTLPRRRTLFP